jgi:threonine/homoserine/homoserine lactone efflux protein
MPAGEEAWGLFTGVFSPVEPGEHRVELSCAEAGSSLETKISVQGTSREKRGQPARLDVLHEIARFTKGAVWDVNDPASVVAAISAMPEPVPQERRLPLWSHPAWAGVLVLLMGIFWVGRKAAGAF